MFIKADVLLTIFSNKKKKSPHFQCQCQLKSRFVLYTSQSVKIITWLHQIVWYPIAHGWLKTSWAALTHTLDRLSVCLTLKNLIQICTWTVVTCAIPISFFDVSWHYCFGPSDPEAWVLEPLNNRSKSGVRAVPLEFPDVEAEILVFILWLRIKLGMERQRELCCLWEVLFDIHILFCFHPILQFICISQTKAPVPTMEWNLISA